MSCTRSPSALTVQQIGQDLAETGSRDPDPAAGYRGPVHQSTGRPRCCHGDVRRHEDRWDGAAVGQEPRCVPAAQAVPFGILDHTESDAAVF
ncbi:hypothetical protein [Streptomyces sp. NBC_01497]|uniref:hypothetical protein n=1 Tax=Streptomyces sp. NBC_01497 TaxID=2903885 RepID=UPI002E34E5D8|nr:hypothetical protein [Streptomyces sp. NBC_01497]